MLKLEYIPTFFHNILEHEFKFEQYMIVFEQNLTISEQFLTLLVQCAACHSKKGRGVSW